MANALSVDLRERVLALVACGATHSLFGLSATKEQQFVIYT
jgi:hypothetical protein